MTETQLLLTCLAEECAEVAQRASKAIRFGLTEVQPGQNGTNAERLVGEYYDLHAVFELLRERGAVSTPHHVAAEAIKAKRAKIAKYLAYSRQCGTVEATE
jgi:hypothetical protein